MSASAHTAHVSLRDASRLPVEHVLSDDDVQARAKASADGDTLGSARTKRKKYQRRNTATVRGGRSFCVLVFPPLLTHTHSLT
jgi:hypothetical protein